MFDGLSLDKLLIVGIIAVFVLGPDRLPYYAKQLARLVRNLRDMADGARDRMRDEMGPDFDDVDWKKLDPRQYDPRRIIREALLDDGDDDDDEPVFSGIRPAASTPEPVAEPRMLAAGSPPPFDPEAT